jgi:hypothetical protein
MLVVAGLALSVSMWEGIKYSKNSVDRVEATALEAESGQMLDRANRELKHKIQRLKYREKGISPLPYEWYQCLICEFMFSDDIFRGCAAANRSDISNCSLIKGDLDTRVYGCNTFRSTKGVITISLGTAVHYFPV